MDVVQARAAGPVRSEISFDGNLDVLSALADPDLSIAGVANLIGTDPSLTAALLRQANSSFYGCARKITTIREAISLIGLEDARELALAVTVKAMMSASRSQAKEHGAVPGGVRPMMPVGGSVAA